MELTREDILAMKPGINLDGLIETLIMQTRKPGPGFRLNPKHYSTDISAAWEVVEKMHNEGICFTTRSRIEGESKYFQVHTFNCDTELFTENEDKSAPLAICRAALLTTIKE